MRRATSDDAHTQAWFDYSRLSVFPQSVRKTGTNVDIYNVHHCHCHEIRFLRQNERHERAQLFSDLPF